MKSKIVLFSSIFISTFLLLAGMGVASAMQNNTEMTRTTPQSDTSTGSGSASAQMANVSQQYATREAAYQNLIAQANQRIETLNNEVSALQQQKNQSSTGSAITADKAAQIAILAAGGSESLQKMPELINYQGNTAFEVNLVDGVVYVDAQTGNVLYNGVPQRITSQQAGEIAGQYLGGMDPKYADIKLINLNGTQIYQVTFSGDKTYVVFIDQTGKVLKAQIYDYTGGGTNPPAIASTGERERESNDD